MHTRCSKIESAVHEVYTRANTCFAYCHGMPAWPDVYEQAIGTYLCMTHHTTKAVHELQSSIQFPWKNNRMFDLEHIF